MRHKALLVTGLLLASGAAACNDGLDFNVDDVEGSGTITTETRDVAGFDEITLAGEGSVIVSEGPEASLTIETDDNLLAHIETTVRDNVLLIATESGIDIDPTRSVTYRVSAPEITGLTLSGAGSFSLATSDSDSLTLRVSGAGDIEIPSLVAEELSVVLSGIGSIVLAGEVATQEVSLSGAGNYEAADLRSITATVTTSGAGSATIWVVDELEASITGVGDIEYFGSPLVTQRVTGLGSIESRGDK